MPDPLDLEERLADLVSDRISLRIVPEIEVLPWRRTQVLALQVHPSPSRPHRLIREGHALSRHDPRDPGQSLRVDETDQAILASLGQGRGSPRAGLPQRSACRPAPRAHGWPAS